MLDYKEEIDYTFIEANGAAGIKIISGNFEDVIYTYSRVSISEAKDDVTDEDLPAMLSFNYDIVDSSGYTEEEFQTIEFKNKIGDILMSILAKSAENTIELEQTDSKESAILG